MNSFNNEDRDNSNRVHAFVIGMVANNMKSNFMAGSYTCAGGDGKAAEKKRVSGVKDPQIYSFTKLSSYPGHYMSPT